MPRDYSHNHIASACYLGQFAGAWGTLAAVDAASGESKFVTPRGAGWRNKFWGPDQAVRTHVERQLSIVEDGAAKALRRVVETDSLPAHETEERLGLMMLIAMHIVRNPAGRRAFLRIQSDVIERNRGKYADQVSAPQFEALLREFSSPGFYAKAVLTQTIHLAGFVGSMHWALVAFGDPVLATSDQPVTIIPLDAEHGPVPVSPIPRGAFIDCSELRVAFGPRHALVASWPDRPDERPARTSDDAFAAQLNRAVIAQADEQWFHHPDRRPVRCIPPDLTFDVCEPVAHRLHTGYSPAAARDSDARRRAAEILNAAVDQERPDGVVVVRVEDLRGAA